MELFESRLDDADLEDRLGDDIREGLAAGVSYTPTVYLNGHRIKTFRRRGDSRYELLKDTIEELIAKDSGSR